MDTLLLVMMLNKKIRRFFGLVGALATGSGYLLMFKITPWVVLANSKPPMTSGNLGSYLVIFGVGFVLFYVIASFWAFVGRLSRNPN